MGPAAGTPSLVPQGAGIADAHGGICGLHAPQSARNSPTRPTLLTQYHAVCISRLVHTEASCSSAIHAEARKQTAYGSIGYEVKRIEHLMRGVDRLRQIVCSNLCWSGGARVCYPRNDCYVLREVHEIGVCIVGLGHSCIDGKLSDACAEKFISFDSQFQEMHRAVPIASWEFSSEHHRYSRSPACW